MPGKDQATGLSVWGSRSPQRTTEWGDGAEDTGTLPVSPMLSTWDKAWSGFRSSTLGTATAGTGESSPPTPTMALEGGRGRGWGGGQEESFCWGQPRAREQRGHRAELHVGES